jgi:hypothetical protein
MGNGCLLFEGPWLLEETCESIRNDHGKTWTSKQAQKGS